MKPMMLVAVVSALVAALPSPSPAVEIVKDGRPTATIVAAVPWTAPAEPVGRGGKKRAARRDEMSEAAAVRVLVDWVRKITDAELPVAAAPGDGPAIYVGQAAIAAGLRLDDIASPSHEGLRIVIDGSRILIAGQNDGATLKAVCRFLELLGCRYFMDGPLGEVFPRTRTLAVGPQTITERPGLLYRNPKGPSWGASLWKAWNGAGGDQINHAHAWGRYVPPSLFKDHPEWFAMGKDGQRREGGWLCTSNGDLRKYFAEQVIAAIEKGARNPSLSPTDGTGYCQCPACKAQDDPRVIEPSSGLVAVSRRYADFFDDVGRRVAQACPDAILSFYCYADYTQPPDLGRRLSPNLCAFMAPIRYCRLHAIGDPQCPSRLQQVEMIEGWARLASKLGYYNYMYNLADATLPMFKFTACKKDFPYLSRRGLTAMTLEVLSNWHIYGPQIYLGLRLAYDPAADADALMEDYWSRFYGPAAAPMKAYWMGIDAAQQGLACHTGSFHGLQLIYTPGFLSSCEARLAQAAEAAKADAACAERVALAAEGLASARAYRSMCDAMARGDFAAARRVYDGLIARLEALAAKGGCNREYGTAYLERFLGKILSAGAAATAPPAKVLQVLPDRWRLEYDPQDEGRTKGFAKAEFDDTAWKGAATYSSTLDAQGLERTTILWYRAAFDVPAAHGGLALFVAEVDGWTEVYVNGVRLAAPPPAPARGGRAPDPAREGQARPCTPFEVDVTDAVRPGRNVVALRVDHSRITELFRGGILRPVLLIEKGDAAPQPQPAPRL